MAVHTSPAAAEPAAHSDWQALGTQVRLVVTDPGRLPDGCSLLTADLAAVDAACSRFRADSELVTVNATAPGRADGVPISPLLAEAVAVALGAARQTGGDVDPTVGAAMAAAGYDRDFALIPQAGPPRRLTVRQVPGWRQVRLDADALRLWLPAAAQLDLGATAKAWAADRSAGRLAERLGCGVLVSLGGDIAVAGAAPRGGWRIRVQDVTGRPEDPPSGPAAVVSISAGGLATSSTAARRWRRGGDVIHHILDPRTGLPAAPVWRTVSVAAARCVAANTASTAAIIKGRSAVDWLAGHQLPSRLVTSDGVIVTVAGWPPDPPADAHPGDCPPGQPPGHETRLRRAERT